MFLFGSLGAKVQHPFETALYKIGISFDIIGIFDRRGSEGSEQIGTIGANRDDSL